MLLRRPSFYPLAFFCALFLFLTILVLQDPFFWDTVQLASGHASFYYFSNFSTLLLPDTIDSGHPPLLGLYLAGVWKCFGRTLWVSHLSMLPFLFGTVYQAFRLSTYLFEKKWAFLVMCFLLLDATVLAQASLVSPDNLLLFFFLLTVNSIFRRQRGLLFCGILGLGLVSIRGMTLDVALFFFYMVLYRATYPSFRAFGKDLLPWIMGGCGGMAFLAFHFWMKGWIGYHIDSPWAGSFQFVPIQGFLKNSLVMMWRLLDFGRISVWLCIGWGLFVLYKSHMAVRKDTKQLMMLFLFVLSFSAPTFLLYKELNAHRYLIPVYICASLLAANLTIHVIFIHIQNRMWVVVFFVVLLSGNFWVYPDSVSKGWDSSLAYLPYAGLRAKMKAYIAQEKIPFPQVSSQFPNLATFDRQELSGDTTRFSSHMLDSPYVFYSNVYNDYSDDELDELKQHWKIQKEFCKGQVRVTLYKNPRIDSLSKQ